MSQERSDGVERNPQLMGTDIISTKTARHWVDEAGIGWSVYNAGVEEVLSDAIENIDARIALFETVGKVVPLLVDLRPIKSQTRDVRAYYGGPQAAKASSALALLVSSRISTLIGNFFLQVQHTSMPIKLFSSQEEALAWLKGFLA